MSVSLEKKEIASEESVRQACAFMILKMERYLSDLYAAAYLHPVDTIPGFMFFAETLELTRQILNGKTPKQLLKEVEERNKKELESHEEITPTKH